MKIYSPSKLNTIKRCRPLLGTFVEMTLEGTQSTERLQCFADKAFELVELVHTTMSFHNPDSDVSRLNQCGHLNALTVHPWTIQVLAKAISLSQETEGAFDVTLVPHLVSAGMLPRHGRRQQLKEAARWQDIELISGASQVFFQRPLKIDLGGIAKGFAVDKAIDYLANCGLSRAIVNAGGDLRVHGASKFEINIRHPSLPHSSVVPSLLLRSAVATTAAYFVRQRTGCARANHIIHPHTGKMLHSNRSVSVFSADCTTADALTKAVLLAPHKVWNRVLIDHDSLALFITKKGEQVPFPN